MLSTRNYLIVGIAIILLFLVIYVVKNKDNYNANKFLEGFESSNSIDLLSRKKNSEVQTTADITSADLEFSINPWTNKIYNLQTTQTQLKPIALYKPHLVINGEKYCKLGDMVSEHTDYSPPDNNEYALLIKKQDSDIKSPTTYNQIINFGNPNIPSLYYQYDQFITSQNNISTVINNIANCMNTLDTLNGLILSGKPIINTAIKNIINTEAKLQIGGSNPLALNIVSNMPVNAEGNILLVGINDTTPLTLPFGTVARLLKQNGDGIDISITPDISITANMTKSSVLTKLQSINPTLYSSLTNDNIRITTLPNVSLFALFMSNPASSNLLVNYLMGLCNDIITILNQPNTKPEFIKYLNLADSVQGVNSLLSALSTLSQPTATTASVSSASSTSSGISGTARIPSANANDYATNIIEVNGVISAYAGTHSNTLLGSVLNIIINQKVRLAFPTLTCTPKDLKQAMQGLGVSINMPLANIQTIAIKNIQTTVYDNLAIGLDNTQNSFTQITNTIKPKLFGLYQFQNDLTSGTIEFFPLQIYEPVAPAGYSSIGHVFCNTTQDLQKIKTMDNVACVPSHCVKDIRDWTATDKIFEYNREGVYWALYKNPYTGTFKAVNRPGVPSGKVCKVVACVAKCNVVDNLIKADECARKYNNLNKSIVENAGTENADLAAGTEEQIYLTKIKNQSDNITRLKTRAQKMQLDISKADIITQEMNKRKLQDYVDTQKRNIDLVSRRLEKDTNTIQANVNIPVEVINEIIRGIRNNPTMEYGQKTEIINKIIKNANELNSNIITQAQYNANLNQIAQSCPQYDLSGLVRKSTVADVCYGCGSP